MDLDAGDRDVPDLGSAWQAAQARLPDGWQLESLRCASAGLDPADRSDDWIAVALGPDGEERRFRAADPVEALLGLAGELAEPAAGPPGPDGPSTRDP